MSPSSNPQSEPSPKKTYRLMAGMAIAAILLIGVAIYSLSQLNKMETTSPTEVSLKAPDIQATLRQNLPQFEYSDEGKSLRAQNFEGKWTLLTFWAYWCSPCLEEMPALDLLTQQWQGPEFQIVTVNVDDPKSENFEAAKAFLTENDISLPTLFDRTGEMKKVFGVTDLPRHFLINPQMKIVWQATGAFNWENSARDQLLKVMELAQEQATETPTPESKPESAK